MTRMTSFLIMLSFDKVSKLHLFILYIALNLLCLGVQLVASGVNGGRLRMKPFWCCAIFYTLFSCSCLLSIHSTIQSSNNSAAACFWHCDLRNEVCCFVWLLLHLIRLHPNLAWRTALLTLHFLSPSCSSFLSLPCIFLILFSINSFFSSDPHFSVDCCTFILLFLISFARQQTLSHTLTCWHYCHYLNDSTASLLLFWCPSLLLFSWILLFLWQFLDLIMLFLSGASLLFGLVSLLHCFMSSLSICMHCLYTFNNYLTTLFDVYCMCYMRTTPTNCCTLPLASRLYQYV
jgi:hypothetical protein